MFFNMTLGLIFQNRVTFMEYVRNCHRLLSKFSTTYCLNIATLKFVLTTAQERGCMLSAF